MRYVYVVFGVDLILVFFLNYVINDYSLIWKKSYVLFISVISNFWFYDIYYVSYWIILLIGDWRRN